MGARPADYVRRFDCSRDALDLGVWRRVSPSKLIVPLDTHVIRVGRELRLTRYASPGWRMARDITESLRRLEPSDPVKYDYSLCHLGMKYPGASALRIQLSRLRRPLSVAR
jgi:uncharacterized protein (TIGR02757 family)